MALKKIFHKRSSISEKALSYYSYAVLKSFKAVKRRLIGMYFVFELLHANIVELLFSIFQSLAILVFKFGNWQLYSKV